jgi:hypothetical protein
MMEMERFCVHIFLFLIRIVCRTFIQDDSQGSESSNRTIA